LSKKPSQQKNGGKKSQNAKLALTKCSNETNSSVSCLALLPLVDSPPNITLSLLHGVQLAVTNHSRDIIAMLLNQPRNPLSLARALMTRLLGLLALSLHICLALQLLDNLGGGNNRSILVV
jgi:hypothetical protein